MIANKTSFDSFAENYRKIHTENIYRISGVDSNYFGEFKIKTIYEQEPPNNTYNILDLGCGDGLNYIYFKKYFKHIKYIGIDISSSSIAKAQKTFKNEGNSKFLLYDGKNIPFKDKIFDIILIACVLHHIPSKQHFSLLKECMRVLKTNGTLYIFEHNPYNPITQKLVKDCPFDDDAVLINSNQLKKQLKKAGVEKINIYYTIFFPRKKFFLKILKLEKLLQFIPLGGQYEIRASKTIHKLHKTQNYSI